MYLERISRGRGARRHLCRDGLVNEDVFTGFGRVTRDDGLAVQTLPPPVHVDHGVRLANVCQSRNGALFGA